MDIQINEFYRIRRMDDKNIVVERRSVLEREVKGSDKAVGDYTEWAVYSYHPNLESACKRLMNVVINTSGARDVVMLLRSIQNASELITRAVVEYGTAKQ